MIAVTCCSGMSHVDVLQRVEIAVVEVQVAHGDLAAAAPCGRGDGGVERRAEHAIGRRSSLGLAGGGAARGEAEQQHEQR